MGMTDSYAYFLPVHALYQIVSIKLCHNPNSNSLAPCGANRKSISSLHTCT